mgnify:CR=1 FL=1
MKKKKRRKIWPVVFAVILFLIILAAAVVLLFRTRTVKVKGNSYYSENTITTLVQRDKLSVNTLYILLKYDFLEPELPAGIKQLNISLENPWTVRVTVEEKEMAGYVDYDEAYLYFDGDGTAALKTKKQIEGVPYIEGLVFDEGAVELGKTLPVEDDSIFDKIVDASRNLKKYNLTPDRISCAEGDVRLYSESWKCFSAMITTRKSFSRFLRSSRNCLNCIRIRRELCIWRITILIPSQYRLYRPGNRADAMRARLRCAYLALAKRRIRLDPPCKLDYAALHLAPAKRRIRLDPPCKLDYAALHLAPAKRRIQIYTHTP